MLRRLSPYAAEIAADNFSVADGWQPAAARLGPEGTARANGLDDDEPGHAGGDSPVDDPDDWELLEPDDFELERDTPELPEFDDEPDDLPSEFDWPWSPDNGDALDFDRSFHARSRRIESCEFPLINFLTVKERRA